MEILELGISGSRSRQANGLDVNKNQKVNEPVSGRVRHAAEELLSLLFKGFFKFKPKSFFYKVDPKKFFFVGKFLIPKKRLKF